MARIGELRQTARASTILPIQPEIFAEDVLVPIGAIGRDYKRSTVRRELQLVKSNVVEKLVKGKFGLVGRVRKRKG